MNDARVILGKAILLALSLLVTTASVASAETRKTVVVLGDSLAAGYGVEPEEAYPALLQEKIKAAGLPFKIVPAGVSGDTTADGLGRLDWLLKRKVDVLIVELGGNDGLRGIPIATIEANLQAIIDRARKKYPDVKIIIAGMRMPPNLGADYVDAYAKVFPEIAARNHVALVPFLLQDVGGEVTLNQADGIHPTPAGHKIVAENVWKVLKPILESLP
ncbi:MAG TPA: arylesterase [Verrucomicrobiae bacterium]|jgi:acyl-CoA thioesterase-1|nr:arylesterase [Verrucomicrobiae bacterium]